jgi:hypothetical protein
MKKQSIQAILILLAVVIFNVAGWAQDKGEFKEEYSGVTAGSGNLSTRKSNWVRISITRWTTDNERALLRQTLAQQGPEKMADVLYGLKKAGSISIQGGVGYDLHYAREVVKDGKRRIVLATDRPITVREMGRNSRSLSYSVSMIELLFDPNAKPRGIISPAVKLKLDPTDNVLAVEDYFADQIRIISLKKEK